MVRSLSRRRQYASVWLPDSHRQRWRRLGHDLIVFHEKFPQLLGRLVVQHIVISGDEKLPSGIEAMKYDLFDPQPIRDANVYYLRTVLHDWPDK